MSTEISDIFINHNKVNQLLNTIRSNKDYKLYKNEQIKVDWIAPQDCVYDYYDLSDVLIKNPSSNIESIQKLIILIQQTFRNPRYNIPIIQFKSIFYPKQVKQCPFIDEIKKMLSEESLIITLHSYNGYSFSAEYIHVYKGKFTKETAYDDLLVILKRGLRAVNPTLSDSNCNHYAEFIIRMASWESIISYSVYENTIKELFPHWKEYPLEIKPLVTTKTNFHYIELYIGYNSNDEFSCTIRLRDRLEISVVDVSTKEKNIINNMNNNNNSSSNNTNTTTNNLNATAVCDLLYYREFILNEQTLESFDVSKFVNTNNTSKIGNNKNISNHNLVPPPPPPPKRNSENKNDIRVYVMFTYTHSALLDEHELLNNSTILDGNESIAASTIDSSTIESIPKKVTTTLVAENTNDISFCSELVGWGYNVSNSLGLGTLSNVSRDKKKETIIREEEDVVYGVRSIPLDRIIALERVKMIACSNTHTMLLTYMGSLYGCGNNTEGALGTGDLISRSSMALVEWISKKQGIQTTKNESTIVKVAAGSSSIGAHTMAIDSQGNLYGWGVAYAVGVGIVKTIMNPTFVAVATIRDPLNPTEVVGVEEIIEDDQEALVNDSNNLGPSLTAVDHKYVVDVSCGGGFTVCVTRAGYVYSWGMWAHGRLGLGPIPLENSHKGSYRRSTKKAARYQMHPRRIRGVEGAISISCGEAHSLCILKNGSLLSWGQNSCGQLGNGPSSAGYLNDAYRPVLIPYFGQITANDETDYTRYAMKNGNQLYRDRLDDLRNTQVDLHKITKISCGAFHSVCLDEKGIVWTWGARGSPCLGHNDSPLVGSWNARINSIFSISTTESKIMVPYELMDWCMIWSMPRLIRALAGGPLLHPQNTESSSISISGDTTTTAGAYVSAKQRIVQICASDLGSGFLSNEGKFFLCGSGPAVPILISASQKLAENEDDDDEDSIDEDVASPKEIRPLVVASPRCPSDVWLRELCTRKVSYIASSGSKMFALLGEEYASYALTSALLNNLLPNSLDEQRQDEQLRSSTFNDETSMSSIDGNRSNMESIFESRGKADCMILASGKVFLCHKAFIAQRSPELRDMILMETPTTDSNSSQPIVQILLPELQRDAMKALLYYLYRDVLPPWAITSTSILSSLSRISKTLRIPRLQVLCGRFLVLLKSDTSTTSLQDNNMEQNPNIINVLELPPPTLARDLSALVGDPEFADVRFIAEGKAIVAHRFILESRCAYFRAMFRSGMIEGNHNHQSSSSISKSNVMIDVVVPDTFIGFLRLLIFIYTSTLPDGSDGALLEDLMASDRYMLPDMKLLCENMLIPTENNWLDLLRASQLLNSLRLELQVISFLKENFSLLQELYHINNDNNNSSNNNNNNEIDPNVENNIQYANIIDFQLEFPGLLDELLEARKILYPNPESQLLIQQTINKKQQEINDISKSQTFPIWTLLIILGILVLYQYITKYFSLGIIIPILNSCGLVYALYLLYQYLKADFI